MTRIEAVAETASQLVCVPLWRCVRVSVHDDKDDAYERRILCRTAVRHDAAGSGGGRHVHLLRHHRTADCLVVSHHEARPGRGSLEKHQNSRREHQRERSDPEPE